MTNRLMLAAALMVAGLYPAHASLATQSQPKPADHDHNHGAHGHEHGQDGHDHGVLAVKPSSKAKVKSVAAGCAKCQFKMKGLKTCEAAIQLEGKAYLLGGKAAPQKSDELCKKTRKAKVAGKIEGERFMATQFTFEP